MRCECCDEMMTSSEEEIRGYCDRCQRYVRQVFDKDAYALGYKDDLHNLGLEFTNYNED